MALIGSEVDDGSLAHPDIFGYIPEHQGPQMQYSLFKKFTLKLQNAFHYPVDGFLTLMYAFNQPGSRPHFILDIVFGITGDFFAAGDGTFI